LSFTARLFCVGLALLAAACGPRAPVGYPPDYEINFMRSCRAQNPAVDICRCTWEKIEANITPQDFAGLERLPPAARAQSPLSAQIQGYGLDCAVEAQGAAAPSAGKAP